MRYQRNLIAPILMLVLIVMTSTGCPLANGLSRLDEARLIYQGVRAEFAFYFNQLSSRCDSLERSSDICVKLDEWRETLVKFDTGVTELYYEGKQYKSAADVLLVIVEEQRAILRGEAPPGGG